MKIQVYLFTFVEEVQRVVKSHNSVSVSNYTRVVLNRIQRVWKRGMNTRATEFTTVGSNELISYVMTPTIKALQTHP
jgi:hypothetical protein